MVQVVALVFAGIFLLFGGIVLSRAGELGDRSETISELASAGDEPVEPGGEATVSGPVHVLEPTSPTRTGPQPNGGDSAALWAWRVRRKENAPNGTRWRTAEAELAIGEFAIDHSWDRVRVDATTLAPDADDDPFDSPELFLGEPETESYLGDLGPVNRFLERTGLASEDGVISDLEFTVNVGGKTTMPDKYQATVVETPTSRSSGRANRDSRRIRPARPRRRRSSSRPGASKTSASRFARRSGSVGRAAGYSSVSACSSRFSPSSKLNRDSAADAVPGPARRDVDVLARDVP